MFEKNDKTFKIAYVIVHVFLAIIAVAVIVVGIILMTDSALIGIVVIVGGLLLTGLLYVIARMMFGFFVDIKLIRNKLYDIDNDGLKQFYMAKYSADGVDGYQTTGVDAASKSVETPLNEPSGVNDKLDNVIRLKKLLDSGVITEQEFAEQKSIILNS